MKDSDILANAPEGATHADDVNEYWKLTDSPKEPSMAWIKDKGWRVIADINGYFFRSLGDIQEIERLNKKYLDLKMFEAHRK